MTKRSHTLPRRFFFFFLLIPVAHNVSSSPPIFSPPTTTNSLTLTDLARTNFFAVYHLNPKFFSIPILLYKNTPKKKHTRALAFTIAMLMDTFLEKKSMQIEFRIPFCLPVSSDSSHNSEMKRGLEGAQLECLPTNHWSIYRTFCLPHSLLTVKLRHQRVWTTHYSTSKDQSGSPTRPVLRPPLSGYNEPHLTLCLLYAHNQRPQHAAALESESPGVVLTGRAANSAHSNSQTFVPAFHFSHEFGSGS
ncbi:hypothetical protein V8E53_000610 [Lactarius tabidus]